MKISIEETVSDNIQLVQQYLNASSNNVMSIYDDLEEASLFVVACAMRGIDWETALSYLEHIGDRGDRFEQEQLHIETLNQL